MNIKHTILLLSIAVFTACSEYDGMENKQPVPSDTDGTEDLVPVEFSMSDQRTIDFTRATTSIVTFDVDERVKVYVKPNGSASYTGYEYTAATYGQNVDLNAPATPPYYPAGTGTKVEAYAYYPSTADPSTAGSTFTVQSDQTSDTNYKASDLMYAENRTVTKGGTDGNDHLLMKHQMAQLAITAQAQAGSGITITGVEVIAKTDVTFDPDPDAANRVTTTGSSGTITALNGAGTGYVVIPPQIINGVTIRIITGAGTDDEIATYRFTGTGTFNSGDSYAIDLTVSPDQLGLSTSINNWNGVGSVNVTPSGNLALSAISAQEYTGSAIEPSFTVKKDGVDFSSDNYTTNYVNNVNAGTAYVIVTGTGTYSNCIGMTSFVITNPNGKLTYSETAVTKTYSTTTFTNLLSNLDIRAGHEGELADGPVTYTSSDPTVAIVNAATGEVTMLKAGNTTITATATNGANYVYNTSVGDNTASYDLTVNEAAGSISFGYSTPSQTWSPTADNNTYTQNVTHTGDGQVTYSIGSTNTCGATIDNSTGEVTFTKSGSVEVIATVKDDTERYSYASKNATYTLTVNKATGYVTLSESSGSVDAGNTVSFRIQTNHGGTLSVADISGNNRSTPTISGETVNITTTTGIASSANIRVTCSATECYNEATTDYALTINRGIDVKMNPLWYVAQYNMTEGGARTFANTDNAGYYYTWSQAMSYFAAQTTSYSTYKKGEKEFGGVKYHLPIQAEWWSIAPGAEANVFTIDSDGSGTYRSAYILPIWGYNDETKGGILESSYWKQINSREIRAIRFLGTDYCSAWKYLFYGEGTTSSPYYVTIYSTLIEKVGNSSAAAASWYTSNMGNVIWGNDEAVGAVQRTFYARGLNTKGSSTEADSQFGVAVDYFGATEAASTTHAWSLCVRKEGLYTSYGTSFLKTTGGPVRLFRDN